MSVTALGIITIVLVLVVLFQIGKASEYVGALKGEKVSMKNANNLHSLLFLIFLFVFMGGVIWSTWYYSDRFLPEPASEHGVWLRTMFFWTLVATVPVFILTHIALFAFAFMYKKSEKRKSFYYPGSNRLEIVWTVIPAIVMVLLVYEGMRNWYKITGPAPDEAMVIEATAQQFYWTLRYSGEDNELGKKSVSLINSDNALGQEWTDEANHDDFISEELHLQVGKPVLVKINSIDVLHSFFLPHFRVKMDAVPGIPTQFWFTPTKTTAEVRKEYGDPEFNFELACTELCGASHYNMRKVVIVEEEAEFEKWFSEQESTYKKMGINTKTGQLDDAKKNVEEPTTKLSQL